MKKSTKIISTALAALTVASTMAVGAVSVSAATVKKPTGVKAANTEKGIKISWKKVKGAKKYKLIRGKKVIKTTKKTSVKDLSVEAGKKYTYKVKAVKGKKTSKASKAVKITRMNYVVIKNINNGDKKVTLNWTKRSGANQYKVYRKTTGSYKKIATVKSTSYTDKSVVSGTKYTYKIRCYNTSTKSSSLYSTAKSTTYLDGVANVTARENTDATCMNVKWDAVKGASSYDVYRYKLGYDGYVKLASTSSTSYTDTKVSKNPTAYQYIVVAAKNGSTSIDYSTSIAPYLPKRNGVNSYYRDSKNNLHVVLKLAVGEQYKEGKGLCETFNLDDLHDVKVTEGTDVVTVNDDVITAVKAGKAVVTVNLSDSVAGLVSSLGNKGASTAYDKAVSKTVYVEVEVA